MTTFQVFFKFPKVTLDVCIHIQFTRRRRGMQCFCTHNCVYEKRAPSMNARAVVSSQLNVKFFDNNCCFNAIEREESRFVSRVLLQQQIGWRVKKIHPVSKVIQSALPTVVFNPGLLTHTPNVLVACAAALASTALVMELQVASQASLVFLACCNRSRGEL